MTNLRFLTAGESHGRGLLAILEGLPANLTLTASDIDKDLARRQSGFGRGGRMKIEKDRVQIISGVRQGKTLGSPLGLLIPNKDWVNWQKIMSVEPVSGKIPAVTWLRPGHADLTGALKYDQPDLRNIIERSSARETAARVAMGAVARKLLVGSGIKIISYVSQIGPVKSDQKRLADLSYAKLCQLAEKSDLRCPDATAALRMRKAIEQAARSGDSLGGVFEVVALNVPIGLGSYVQWDRRLGSRLAAALLGIPAIKGVEFGLGFAAAALTGSQVHDPIYYKKGQAGGFFRKTNQAGGLEGGISNGQPLVLRCAMKPIATLARPLPSVDLISKRSSPAHRERADVCAVPAAGVVGEAMTALVLADALLEKFGGDSVKELKANLANWRSQCYNA